jgi:hypothetical protein
MYYMYTNKNFVHRVGDQPRLYYDALSTNHEDLQKVFEDKIKPVQACIDARGHHFQQLL